MLVPMGPWARSSPQGTRSGCLRTIAMNKFALVLGTACHVCVGSAALPMVASCSRGAMTTAPSHRRTCAYYHSVAWTSACSGTRAVIPIKGVPCCHGGQQFPRGDHLPAFRPCHSTQLGHPCLFVSALTSSAFQFGLHPGSEPRNVISLDVTLFQATFINVSKACAYSLESSRGG